MPFLGSIWGHSYIKERPADGNHAATFSSVVYWRTAEGLEWDIRRQESRGGRSISSCKDLSRDSFAARIGREGGCRVAVAGCRWVGARTRVFVASKQGRVCLGFPTPSSALCCAAAAPAPSGPSLPREDWSGPSDQPQPLPQHHDEI